MADNISYNDIRNAFLQATDEEKEILLRDFPQAAYSEDDIKTAFAQASPDELEILKKDFPEFGGAGLGSVLLNVPAGALAATGESVGGLIQAVEDFTTGTKAGKTIADESRFAGEGLADEMSLRPDASWSDYAKNILYSGATSAAQQAPLVAAAAMGGIGPMTAAAAMGALSGGQQYSEARKQNYGRGAALVQGLAYGGAETLGEKIGIDALLAKTGMSPKALAAKLVKYIATEEVSEVSTEAMQYATDVLAKEISDNKDAKFEDLWPRMKDTFMSTLVAAPLLGGVGVGSQVYQNSKNVQSQAPEQQTIIPDEIKEDEIQQIAEQAGAENAAPQNQQATTDFLTGQSDTPPQINPLQQAQQVTAEMEAATDAQQQIAGEAIKTILQMQTTNAQDGEQGADAIAPDANTRPALPESVKTPEIKSDENETAGSNNIPAQTISVNEINQAPELQFKRNVDKNLVTDKLKGRKYNELLAGAIDVFVNPEDGKTYVWNGNHRLVNAKENNVPAVKALYTDFANMEEARAAAVLKNLAENNGEPLDYRNFFREVSEKDFNTLKNSMAEKGIDISKGMAVKGYALSKLNDYLSSEYEKGALPENVAVEIGKNQLSDADQNALYKHVKAKYLENKTVPNNGQIKNLIEFAKSTPKQEGEADLFGDTEVINQMSVKSEIADYIGNTIKRDKNILKKLSSEDLASAVNEKELGDIKTDQAAAEAQKAALAEMYFKKRMFAAGDEISTALNDATQRTIDGEAVNKVKAETFLKARRILESEAVNGVKPVNEKPSVVEPSVTSREPKPAERNAATESVAENTGSEIGTEAVNKIKIADIKTIEELAANQAKLTDAKVTSIQKDKATVNFKGKEYIVAETPTGLKYEEYEAPQPKAKQDGLFEEDLTDKERDQKAGEQTTDMFMPAGAPQKRKSSSDKAFYDQSKMAAPADETNEAPPKRQPSPHVHAVAGKLNELNRVELIKLAEDILNSIPEVRKRIRKEALGIFRHNDLTGKAKIMLDASRLKDADYQKITEVLAHEIGHAIDWKEGEVNRTLSRGNVLGHIGALARFMKTTLNIDPEGSPQYLTKEQRQKIYRDTKKRLAESASWAENDYSNSFFSEVYKDEVSKYLTDNNLIAKELIQGEMMHLSQEFLGWSDENVESAKDWFMEPSELYANTFGAFLTNPKLIFEMAPTAGEMLYNYLKNKPATLKLYQYFQQKINGGDRYAENLNYVKAKMMQADARQSEQLTKTKEGQSLKDDLLTNFMDRLTPLLKYADVANRDESSFKMLSVAQKLRSMNDIIESYLKGFLPGINKIIEDNNLDITDIGLKAYFTRVIEERSKQGIIDLTDKALAENLNAELNTHYNAEQIAAMETIFDKLHEARKPLIESLVTQGLFKPELAKKLLDNKYYFTFDITEHLDETLGSNNSISQRIHKQYGTLKVSANPFVSTILKDIALTRLNIEMAFNRQAILFLAEKEVSVTKAKKDQFGRPLAPPLKSGMGLVEILESGKPAGYYIPADIAKAINENTFEAGAGFQALAAINNISRGTFTSGSPGFLISNLFRDVQGTFLKLPYVLQNFGTWSAKMAAAFKNAVTNAEDEKTINEMLGRGLLYGDRSMNYQPDADLSTWDNILRKYKIANYEDFKAANVPAYLKIINMVTAAGEYLVSPLLNLSARIEKASKVGAFNFLNEIKDKHNLSEAEINWLVAELAGTPNAKRKGLFSPYTNNLLIFSNVWAQGYKSHIDAAKYSPYEYFTKLAGVAAAPVILTWVLSMFDDDGWWGKISEYYKSSYHIIPVHWFGGPKFDENGKPVFLTLPKEEMQRAVGATLWKALNSLKEGQIREGFSQIFDVWAGDTPKLTPIFNAVSAVKQYVSGNNPFDYFRWNYAIDPRTFDAKDFSTDKAFLIYLANLFGLNVFYRMDPSYRKTAGENPSALERISKMPAYGFNAVGRILKVDDRGQQQQARELIDQDKTKNARELNRVDSYIEKINNERLNEITQEERDAKNKHLGYFKNQKLKLKDSKKAQIKAAPKDVRKQVREVLK